MVGAELGAAPVHVAVLPNMHYNIQDSTTAYWPARGTFLDL
jgi:hypothetical protein